MKIKIIESEIVTTKMYYCDYCKNKSMYERDILQCEKQHTCKHKFKYEFDNDNEADGFVINGIEKICRNCGYKEDGINFYDIYKFDDQVQLEKVYNLLLNK